MKNKNYEGGFEYPQSFFFYILERGVFLKEYETRIIKLKEKINSLLVERMKNKHKINY